MLPDSDVNNPLNKAIVLLGESSHGNGQSPIALTSRSICPDDIISQLPSKTSASFAAFVENCIVVCGGKENTLELNNECWKYNLTTHHPNNDEHEEESSVRIVPNNYDEDTRKMIFLSTHILLL